MTPYEIKLTQDNINTMLARLTDGRGQATIGGDGMDKYNCMYRNPEGIPCVLGSILPDDVAWLGDNGREIEGCTSSNLTARDLRNNGVITVSDTDLALLISLQDVHDTGYNWIDGSITSDVKTLVSKAVKEHGFTGYPLSSNFLKVFDLGDMKG